ncbi:MAG: Hsp70 family protein [Nitrososphaerales archaeon]
MKYVGIDLGTTNSAICSYDGESIRLYKNPEYQTDVTPSAIFIDARGKKYIGTRAYDNAARSPGSAATLFKRFMGTSTPMALSSLNIKMSPEECSAEILRVLYGYLPEEIRNDPDTGAVITVPAAFNQMQKDATMTAANMAGIGRVALMQEPVAAVMSVMKHRQGDGIFVIYDIGGGTLDVAVAESISGRVSLLAHGGIAMCGGREFDRQLFRDLVKPWLLSNFKLPPDFDKDTQFRQLVSIATWAAEKAKIALSQSESASISVPENELGVRDLSGQDIYIDIPIKRDYFNTLVAPTIAESISSATETLKKAGLSAQDLERIVFIGGPTQYKPLRDKVAQGLGIAPSTDVNPMTAVAEGAAIFAEAIDWSSKSRGRKNLRGEVSSRGSINVAFNYIARTPGRVAKLVAKANGTAIRGAEFQIDSLASGWSSGRIALVDGATVDLPLAKPGDNLFKVFLFDAAGGALAIPNDKIVIAQTAASIDAIPASHSIGVEVRDKIGGRTVLDYLVREGDQLPKKGKKVFRSEESLKSGTTSSLKFKLWEGEITDPITDNRFIGMFEIKGNDFVDNVIGAGAELMCEYEILDSGNIVLDVSVPSIGAAFKGQRNYYSRQDGQIDYSNASQLVASQSEQTSTRLDEMEHTVEDPLLSQARDKLQQASSISSNPADPETTKKAMDDVQEARRMLALVRRGHLTEIRQLELNKVREFFNEVIRKLARPTEVSSFDNLVKTAQRSIDNNSADFEAHLDDLRSRNFTILWRQDWYVIDKLKYMIENPHQFANQAEYSELVKSGSEALKANDLDRLRKVVSQLFLISIDSGDMEEMMANSNILRG